MRDLPFYDRNDPDYIDSFPPRSPTLQPVPPWRPETETASSSQLEKPHAERHRRSRKKRRRLSQDPGSLPLLRMLGPSNPEIQADYGDSSESEADDNSEMTELPASDEKPNVDGIDKATEEINVSPKSAAPGPRSTAPDANALKARANEVLQHEAKVATSQEKADGEAVRKPRVDSTHDKIEHPDENRPRSGRVTPNLRVKTQTPPHVKDDTIATSPTLRKHVIPVAENAPGTLPAMQCSPTRDGSATSPQNEKLPSLRHVTSQMAGPLNELAAVALQQDQLYTQYHGQSLGSASAQSPMLPYHNFHSNETSPSGQHSMSATSPTSPNSEQYYGSPPQYRPAFLTDRRSSAGTDQRLRFPPSLPSASSSGGSQGHTGSSTDGYSTSHTTPIDATQTAHSTPGQMLPPPSNNFAGFRCDFPGCTAAPFHTQYLLSSHKNVHSQTRNHYCPVKDCPRGEGGKGFKRKNEMMRHGLVHSSPGYICPFCPEKEHRYPRPDNLQRHVRVHHVDKDRDDPQLREVLSQRTEGCGKTRRRRTNTNSST